MKHVDFLTGDLARDRRNVDLLLGAVERMDGSLDADELWTRAVDSALELTEAERGALVLVDGKGGFAVRVAREKGAKPLPLDLRISGTAVRKVLSTGQPALEEPDFSMSVQAQQLRCVLAVPIRRADRAVGVLYVDSRAIARSFTKGDLTVFASLATLAAAALERNEGERRRRDLEAARSIQLGMAPRGFTPPAGFDVAFEGRSADETSGDYHDAVPLGDGSFALVVGDVSGHGLAAALHMTSVRAVLRTLLRSRKDPAEVIAELNAFLCEELRDGKFMTLFLVVVDPASRSLRWAGAGHTSLLVRAGGATEVLGPSGPALGVVPGAVHRAGGPVALGAGDALVLATDGIAEAMDARGEMYGEEERLLPSIRAHAARVPGARGLLDGVLADFRAFVGTTPVEDDVTAVVLRAT